MYECIWREEGVIPVAAAKYYKFSVFKHQSIRFLKVKRLKGV
jgi:hypothetical protein